MKFRLNYEQFDETSYVYFCKFVLLFVNFSALEVFFMRMRYINLHLTLTFDIVKYCRCVKLQLNTKLVILSHPEETSLPRRYAV